MKYFWITGTPKDVLRGIGANHIHATEFVRSGMKKTDLIGTDFMFQAEEGFELFCKLVTGLEPVEFSERHYNRLVRGHKIPAGNAYQLLYLSRNPIVDK